MNWRKSSYSGQSGGNCVEIADSDSRVLVRDTKNRASVVLRFSPAAWRRFAEQVKRSLASDLTSRKRLRSLIPPGGTLASEGVPLQCPSVGMVFTPAGHWPQDGPRQP
jgi:hypothetical protein